MDQESPKRRRRRSRLLISTVVAISTLNSSHALLTPCARSDACRSSLSETRPPSKSRVIPTMASDTYMFLKGNNAVRPVKSLADSSSVQPRLQYPSNVNIWVQEEEANICHYNNKRGMLGFCVFDWDQQSIPDSSSQLMVSRSQVNIEEWNGRDNVFSPKKSVNPILNRSPTNQVEGSRSLLWLPWLPTYTQIQFLTVAELKQVCGERGLKKTGKKEELRNRVLDWTKTKLQQQRRLVLGSDHATKFPDLKRDSDIILPKMKTNRNNTDATADAIQPLESTVKIDANSLGEWARTFDIEPLQKRRAEIHKEKREGKVVRKEKKASSEAKRSAKEDRSLLTKLFNAPSSQYSNLEVKEMYAASKKADQCGDRDLAKLILWNLKKATPNDARIYRRLARMETEEGNLNGAREILQEGVRHHPNNAYLLHGQGLLELQAGHERDASIFFRKAISLDPAFPNAYHALGTLQHGRGRIANAMKTLKQGLRYCPSNHRLHHALGDLYKEAKLLDRAEKSYRRSLELCPGVSRGFSYNSLAHVSYEKGNVDKCRSWLKKAVTMNYGRNAQAWVSLAQLEESEGNIDAARSTYIAAITQYEGELLKRHRKRVASINYGNSSTTPHHTIGSNAIEMKNQLLKSVPVYRSGDRFLKVYRNWARLEERFGSLETVNEVYERASIGFPKAWVLTVTWAKYHAHLQLNSRARQLFSDACDKVGNRHADPYRIYGEFEMALGNYEEAREILFRGAIAMSHSSDGGFGSRSGMAEMFLTWAVCEWHLGDLSRAEVLFDNALRLTDAGDEGSQLRSFIFYSIACLEYERKEYHLAQHCIGLCLKENLMPGGNSKIWKLWAAVAADLGNDVLAEECIMQSEVARAQEGEGISDLSRLLTLDSPWSSSSSLSRMKGADIHSIFRLDPWHDKVFTNSNSASTFYRNVKLPETLP